MTELYRDGRGRLYKKCANPFCTERGRFYKKETWNPGAFAQKKYCNAICADEFHNRLNNEISRRLREEREDIREEVLKEWGV